MNRPPGQSRAASATEIGQPPVPVLLPERQREFAVEVVKKLRAAGFTAYWAGGCVRDRLLGACPKDYDVATDATPEQIRQVFGRRRSIGVGAAFGVMAVLGGRGAGQIEVATFRSDAAYSDGRHPDSVTFASDREDALRRDFTINGLFYDPLADRVIDYVGGREDLEKRIVRAIGDPHARFAEDKLRLLRAVRFAATLDFQLDADTLAAIASLAADITLVSAERIAQEMRLMLVHEQRVRALRLLRQTGLLEEVLPEAAALPGGHRKAPSAHFDHAEDDDPWGRTLRVLGKLDRPSFAVALAALLHVAADSEDAQLSTPETDAAGAPTDPSAVAKSVGARWKLPNKEIDRVAWLLTHLPTIAEARQAAWPRLQRILISPGIEELLTLAAAVVAAQGGDAENVSHCRELLALPVEQLDPPDLLDGNDLIDHGVPRGKLYSQLLRRVRDAQLEGHIQTKQDALRYVDRLLEDRAGDTPPPLTGDA